MRYLVLILTVSFTYARPQTDAAPFCPAGYEDAQNGYCYKAYLNALNVSRDAASSQCNFDGGRLPTIPNAFINNFLKSMASTKNMPAIWTGLICQNSSKLSCQFDSAKTSLNSTSYSNFATGYPDPSHGPFVTLNPSTGLWQTTGYNLLAFICEVPKGNPTYRCSQGYTQHENNCYKYLEPASASATEAVCDQDDAHLASIHSSQDNNYTTSFADTNNHNLRMYPYYRIGLKSNPSNQLSWIDGSNYDYNNFGLENNNYGSCVAVALTDDTFLTGQWTSSNCDKELPAVCKKATEARYSPYSPPSISAPQCLRNTALNGGGTFYSPNYPSPYNGGNSSTTCAYVLTADRNVVIISFPEFNLESDSSISLYND